MSRFKNEITHLQAHIMTLRLGARLLVMVALVRRPATTGVLQP